MSNAEKRKTTYEEYLALEARTGVRHEHLAGETWAMAGGTPTHALLAMNAGFALRGLLERGRCRVYSSDLRLFVPATGLSTYADVAVVCGELKTAPHDANAATNPTVLVEVLSASTESYDRIAKFAHYRRLESLQAYVLVSQDEARVEVYERDKAAWTYVEATTGERVGLRCLGGDLVVDDLYADVVFAAG